MVEDLSIDNFELIQELKMFIAKNIQNLSKEEQIMFEKILKRLKYAEY